MSSVEYSFLEWNYHPVENPYFDRFASGARQEQQFRACQKAAQTKLPVWNTREGGALCTEFCGCRVACDNI